MCIQYGYDSHLVAMEKLMFANLSIIRNVESCEEKWVASIHSHFNCLFGIQQLQKYGNQLSRISLRSQIGPNKYENEVETFLVVIQSQNVLSYSQ